MFFDGWNPSKTPADISTEEEFQNFVLEKSNVDYINNGNVGEVIQEVIAVIKENIERGQIEDTRSILPEKLKPLFD